MSKDLKKKTAATPEPRPTHNTYPRIVDLVEQDLNVLFSEDEFPHRVRRDLFDRAAEGEIKYGTALQPFNGRNVVNDLYQELLDGVQYARQALYEEQQKEQTSSREVRPSFGLPRKLGAIYRKLISLSKEVAAIRDTQDGCGAEGTFRFTARDVKFDVGALSKALS